MTIFFFLEKILKDLKDAEKRQKLLEKKDKKVFIVSYFINLTILPNCTLC